MTRGEVKQKYEMVFNWMKDVSKECPERGGQFYEQAKDTLRGIEDDHANGRSRIDSLERELKRNEAHVENLAQELVQWQAKVEQLKKENERLNITISEGHKAYQQKLDELNRARLLHEEAAQRQADEKQKNLFDRKVFIFASLVQTWLAAPAFQSFTLTPCRAAWIQGQAFLVSPSVLGEMGANFNAEGSLAWQVCDFCKTLSEFDQWPSWTELR